MDHIGIDVHKRESQISILAEGGEVVEQRIRTEPERFAAVLGTRPRARILVEASTDSEWVARCLEALGHEVIVADPNVALMYATRSRKVKTDRRDARALAEACLLGAYRPAHRLSDPQRHGRGRLGVRDTLVHTRTRSISLIRALLRQHGYRVPSGSAEGFIHRVQALPLPGRLLSVVAPLRARLARRLLGTAAGQSAPQAAMRRIRRWALFTLVVLVASQIYWVMRGALTRDIPGADSYRPGYWRARGKAILGRRAAQRRAPLPITCPCRR